MIEIKIKEEDHSNSIESNYKKFTESISEIQGEPTEVTVILFKNILNYL